MSNEITNEDIAKMTPEQRLALAGSPVAAPQVSPTGMVAAVGAPAVDRFRLICILTSLKFEAETGMKMTRDASPLKIVREEFGIKTRNKADAYKKFRALLVEHGVILTEEERKKFKLRGEEDETPGA